MNIDKRMATIEKKLGLSIKGKVSGVMIERMLNPNGKGVIWSLTIGGMMQPKEFYTGNTIDEILTKAEKRLNIR